MLTDDRTISSALADLAATTGDQPLPLAPIEVRARRLRRGRRAGRAGIVVVCVATLATGIGLAGSGAKPSQVSFGAASVVLPLCTTLPAQPAPGSVAKAPAGADAKRAAAGSLGVGAGQVGVPLIVGEKFKAPGTVAGTPTADRVTILVAFPLNATPEPVTFAISADTQFSRSNQPSAAQILRAGETVGFAATKTGPSSYRLDVVDTTPASPADGSRPGPSRSYAATPFPAGRVNPNASLPAIGKAFFGKGFLAAVPTSRATTVSVTGAGGALGGRTLRFSVTPASRFMANERQCDPSGLPAGTPAGFTATRTGPASYRLDQLTM